MALLLLIDGHSQAYRAYFGMKTPLSTRDGEPTGAVYGFASTLRALPDQGLAVAVVCTKDFANEVAAAGGSDEAILVATTNVESEFRDALAKVRGDLLPCTYLIPEEVRTGEVGVTYVNVAIGLAGADPEITPQNPSCDGPGWRYDNATDPTAILLCPETCDAISADTEATIAIRLGCSTIVK